MAEQQQQQQQSPTSFQRMSLDKIIEAMTADLESSSGHYVQFGVTPQTAQNHNWTDYSMEQSRHYTTNPTPHPNLTNVSTVNPSIPMYVRDVPNFEPAVPTTATNEPVYFSPQTVNHLGINENNDLVGTIDVGGGNYINVIYGNASQIMAEQYQLQLNNRQAFANTGILNREYGLFDEQQMNLPTNLGNTQNRNSKQLIDNLVGNWVPNQSGTYSPFGGTGNTATISQQTEQIKDEDLSSSRSLSLDAQQQKKPRMVAEVKPMRLSYSDVLTKSAPTPPSPLTVPCMKTKLESLSKKVAYKNSKNKAKPVQLKRQNSSGSDDHNSPKIKLPKKPLEKNTNLPRRWVSLDNLDTQSDEVKPFDRLDKFEKVKKIKVCKKSEKNIEALNNAKIQCGNAKATGNTQKRPLQINNNLNTTNSFSQTVSPSKIEKNQQANNKTVKESDKRVVKEKTCKRFQAEKAQQIKKGQRNRKREHREYPVRDFFRNLNKYVYRWSKIALKILLWLLHLISDVIGMSANLVTQLGKCVWYHSILYMKYSWLHIAGVFSKIRCLNAFGKQIDSWFGTSRFAFWRRISKNQENSNDDSGGANWIHGGLENNIALPSTGEEAMKRLLACKGKDPYSILGVTPTCSDDDIKKYYKRQAFLVHPDKNSQPGAEEAFKILVHAFDIIGEPERRQAFDQTRQVEAAWGELSDLLSQLHRKMEQAANTIRCTNCGLRHKRIPTQRPCYAARFCAQCKIRHSAKEGDIWAESRFMGFLWHYYACMEGAVYDVTEWAACQAGNLKHLRANIHSVQYRIVLGQRPPSQTCNSSSSNGSSGGNNASANSSKKRQPADSNTSEADFEDFLNNLYNHNKSGNTSTSTDQNPFKNDNRRRKGKRKK